MLIIALVAKPRIFLRIMTKADVDEIRKEFNDAKVKLNQLSEIIYKARENIVKLLVDKALSDT